MNLSTFDHLFILGIFLQQQKVTDVVSTIFSWQLMDRMQGFSCPRGDAGRGELRELQAHQPSVRTFLQRETYTCRHLDICLKCCLLCQTTNTKIFTIKRQSRGCGEMAQSGKSSLYKCKELRLIPRIYIRKWSIVVYL